MFFYSSNLEVIVQFSYYLHDLSWQINDHSYSLQYSVYFPWLFQDFFFRSFTMTCLLPPTPTPLVWDLLRFLDLWISVFNQFWKSLGHKFFIYFLGPILSLLSIWDLNYRYVRLFYMISHLFNIIITDVLFIFTESFFLSVS